MVDLRTHSYYHTIMNQATELYLRITTAVRSFSNLEEGASMVEYALLIALIAVVAVAAVATFGGALSDEFDRIADSMPT